MVEAYDGRHEADKRGATGTQQVAVVLVVVGLSVLVWAVLIGVGVTTWCVIT